MSAGTRAHIVIDGNKVVSTKLPIAFGGTRPVSYLAEQLCAADSVVSEGFSVSYLGDTRIGINISDTNKLPKSMTYEIIGAYSGGSNPENAPNIIASQEPIDKTIHEIK